VVVIANNLSELQFSDLARQMRFVAASNVMIMTKLLALALSSAGACRGAGDRVGRPTPDR
jgi:hypothetical protein